MRFKHLFRSAVFILLFPELRELIKEGNQILIDLERQDGKDGGRTVLVQKAIDLLWQRNLTDATKTLGSIDTSHRSLLDSQLLSFIISLRAKQSSISGLPYGVR